MLEPIPNFQEIGFSSWCGATDGLNVAQVCPRRSQECVRTEEAPLLSWTPVEQREHRSKSIVCSYYVCFPPPRHLPTPSLTATDKKVPLKCSCLAPEAAELGGLKDTICTPINPGHSDFLDYLVVTVHAVQHRAKISFHGFTVLFRVFFLNLCKLHKY